MTDTHSVYGEMEPRAAELLRIAIGDLHQDLADGVVDWLPAVFLPDYSPEVLARFNATLADLACRFSAGTVVFSCVAEQLVAWELLNRVICETGAMADDDSVAGLADPIQDLDFLVAYEAEHEDDVVSVHHHFTGWWTPLSPVGDG